MAGLRCDNQNDGLSVSSKCYQYKHQYLDKGCKNIYGLCECKCHLKLKEISNGY